MSGKHTARRCACGGERFTAGGGNSTALARGAWYDIKRCLKCGAERCFYVGDDVTDLVRPPARTARDNGDLLEACEAVYRECLVGKLWAHEAREAVESLRAAIEKARGEK